MHIFSCKIKQPTVVAVFIIWIYGKRLSKYQQVKLQLIPTLSTKTTVF